MRDDRERSSGWWIDISGRIVIVRDRATFKTLTPDVSKNHLLPSGFGSGKFSYLLSRWRSLSFWWRMSSRLFLKWEKLFEFHPYLEWVLSRLASRLDARHLIIKSNKHYNTASEIRVIVLIFYFIRRMAKLSPKMVTFPELFWAPSQN